MKPISRRTLLGGAAAVPLLSGCGAGSSRGGGGKKRTVEVWVWETEQQWKQVERTSGLDQQFPDVEFRWTALPQDQLHQKALVALGARLADGLPSIIRLAMPYYRAFVNTNGLYNMTSRVEPHKAKILPGVYDGALVGDQIYQVPDDTGVMLLGYREDIFHRLGLPSDPDGVAGLFTTYDDMIAAGRAMHRKGIGLFNEVAGQTFNNLILQDSTGYFDKQGNVIYDSDYHVEVAELSLRIWKSGLTTHFEDSGPQMWEAYKSGQLATMFYPNWQDFTILDAAPTTRRKWKVTKLPAVHSGGRRASSADGCAQAVPDCLPDDQKKLAADVSTYLRLTTKATVAHMKTFSGAFVSYQPGLEAMTDLPSPVLDKQDTYKIYLGLAQSEKILPWYRTSIFFNDASDSVSNAIYKILLQGAPIKKTLHDSANFIRRLQDAKGRK